MNSHDRMESALALHATAAEEVLRAAEAIPAERWHQPRGEGKWSPAEVLAHLVSTCDIVLKELEGRGGMEIRTGPLQRTLLRLILVPRLLAGGAFPKGARAPRETRPGEVLDREPALALFRERTLQMEEAARNAAPGRRITHAYFGAASVPVGMRLVARHTQHHCAQLQDLGGSEPKVERA